MKKKPDVLQGTLALTILKTLDVWQMENIYNGISA